MSGVRFTMSLCRNNQLDCVVSATQGECDWNDLDYRAKHACQVDCTLKKVADWRLIWFAPCGFLRTVEGDFFIASL